VLNASEVSFDVLLFTRNVATHLRRYGQYDRPKRFVASLMLSSTVNEFRKLGNLSNCQTYEKISSCMFLWNTLLQLTSTDHGKYKT